MARRIGEGSCVEAVVNAASSSAPQSLRDADGFRAFYDSHAAVVYGYLVRLCGGDRSEAEDLAQEVWCALVDALRAGHAERATAAWLLTVARSRFVDRWRRAQRATRPVRIAWAADESVDPWEPVRGDVLEHLMMLDTEHRIVLALRYIDGLAVGEIAELMHRSSAATYSLLARGRQQLRERLEGARDG
jgi:RNA polymerase sigma-70 factor, ECF subfamily